MKQVIILLIHILIPTMLFSQEDLPKPTAEDIVFYIQHNKGKNVFFYQANLNSKGDLDADKPLLIKRQLYDNDGEIKPISAIQNRFAYGLHIHKKSTNDFEIALVSYPKQKLFLKMGNDKVPYVETMLHGKYLKLERLFIVQDKESFGLKRKVKAIHFYGYDKDGNPTQEQLCP